MMAAGGWSRRVLGWWLAWVVLAAGGYAQQGGVASVRFSVFALRPVAGLTFVPRAGAAPVKLALYPTARSPRHEYRGAQPLRLLDQQTGKPVAEAAIPAGMQDVLLLLTPLDAAAAAKTGLAYQVSVLDDSWARQGAGGLSVVNLSGLALSGTVGGETVTVQPGLNAARRIASPADVVLETPVKGKPRRAYGGKVTLRPNERALLLIFPPLRPGSPEVQSRLLVDATTVAKPPGQGR
jgi:hypothetical protein